MVSVLLDGTQLCGDHFVGRGDADVLAHAGARTDGAGVTTAARRGREDVEAKDGRLQKCPAGNVEEKGASTVLVDV